MAEPKYIVRYRSCPERGGETLLVEDERGDLYACTPSGLACRVRLTHVTPLLQRGWTSVEGAAPQLLDAIVRALRPVG